MSTRPVLLMFLVLAAALGALPAAADDAPGHAPNGGLATLIPGLFGPEGLFVESEASLPGGGTHSAHFNSDFQAQFTQFNTALAGQLASVPVPSAAAGFTYSFDPNLGIFERNTESFGPIFADRVETIGRGKLTVSTLYQRFTFDEIEGNDLSALPAVFTHDGAAPGGRADVVTTVNAIDASVDQLALFLTYGLTQHVDVSVVVPMVTAELSVASTATVQRIGTSSNTAVHFYDDGAVQYGDQREYFSSGSASGLGDLLVRVKGAVLRNGSGAGLALGVDGRIPTGDELDLLGSGAWGARPFVAFSWAERRFSPHLNLGYQWNGDSILAGDPVEGVSADMPDQLQWAVGADLAVSHRVTVAGELLGRHVFESPRLVTETFHALDGITTFPDIGFVSESFAELLGSLGLKANIKGRLLLDFNVLFSLNDAGLRDKVIPLVGVEYTF